MMSSDLEIVRLLRSIDRRLALLSAELEGRIQARLRKDLLRSPARIAMFAAIDGRVGSSELATRAAVTERAAQAFVKELLEIGFVSVVHQPGSRGVVVVQNEDAITAWYLAHVQADDSPSKA